MKNSMISSVLEQVPLLNQAYQYQREIVPEVWQLAKNHLGAQEHAASEFQVLMDDLPEHFLDFDRNIFSTFFMAVMKPLGISEQRRRLYGKLNQLFRVWVTSADNLLDDEDKQTFIIEMTGESRVMRQVVAVMLADRVMTSLLDQSVASGVISFEESRLLALETLRVLLPSAAEEGMEEGGLDVWPEPDVVLHELHPLKTGILFHVPFLGAETIEEDIDPVLLADLKAAMMDFGVACQILDDLRDMSRDYLQRKANYIVSLLAYDSDGVANMEKLDQLTQDGDLEKPLYMHFPSVLQQAGLQAFLQLSSAFEKLDKLGLTGLSGQSQSFAHLMVQKLDLKEWDMAL